MRKLCRVAIDATESIKYKCSAPLTITCVFNVLCRTISSSEQRRRNIPHVNCSLASY